MTVGIVIKCSDGIVLACDSLATFGRGVPVARYTNKVHVIEHPALRHPVAMIGAGTMTFVGKFLNRADGVMTKLFEREDHEPFDIDDFAERVCETIASFLFKEYVIDRAEFFGRDMGEFSFSVMIAGATHYGELRAYFVRSTGLTESIADCGTIGSGAAFAELFLRQLIPDLAKTDLQEGACLASYAIKGVEIMDPYVGGETNISTLAVVNDALRIKRFPKSKMPKHARAKMETVLAGMAESMRSLVK
jgi:20S proteasome alpha/beta subunit